MTEMFAVEKFHIPANPIPIKFPSENCVDDVILSQLKYVFNIHINRTNFPNICLPFDFFHVIIFLNS